MPIAECQLPIANLPVAKDLNRKSAIGYVTARPLPRNSTDLTHSEVFEVVAVLTKSVLLSDDSEIPTRYTH